MPPHKKGHFNPYWQISGKFLRSFYWKTHPSKKYEYLFIFFLKPGRDAPELKFISGKFLDEFSMHSTFVEFEKKFVTLEEIKIMTILIFEYLSSE